MKRSFVAVCILLAGCATEAQLEPSDVDRSKGTVELSLVRGQLEYSMVTPESGVESASQACRSIGYRLARPLGSMSTTCNVDVPSNCPQYKMTAKYQCIK